MARCGLTCSYRHDAKPRDLPIAERFGAARASFRAMSCARTLKHAKRLALIAPEALAATKLAINRGADASGFPQCPAGRARLGGPALCRDRRGRRAFRGGQ